MCDCIFWAKMTSKYEVLHEKTYNVNKNLPKSACFDHDIRHFDSTKSQNRPFNPTYDWRRGTSFWQNVRIATEHPAM